MELQFSGQIWFWRGPAPWHFVSVPKPECEQLQFIATSVTYGWGMIPARACISQSEWATSLFPKDGGYILPVKVWVREAESLELGDTVQVRLVVDG